MITILFEDEVICVIDKPAGIVVNDADSVKDVTVQQWFSDKIVSTNRDSEFYAKGGVVHRLDKDTSGVMVLAKTYDAYENLKNQFLERKTKKEYVAMIHGMMKEDKGIISLPIERFSKNKSKFAVGTDLSRMAITEWETVEKFKEYSLVRLMPLTGRTHQLRVHLQHMGHPIVSDPIYGWKKQQKADLAWCPRLFLHAKQLAFNHPVTGTTVVFESALPADLAQARLSLVH